MSTQMRTDDPAYWMLEQGLADTSKRSKTTVHSGSCYICRDPEFALMGLPLCYPCSKCGGHEGATLAFWKSDNAGRPANGGASDPVHVGLVQEEPGPLSSECGRGALHATLDPSKWRGQRLWVVALWGEVSRGEDKLWALKREFVAEINGVL